MAESKDPDSAEPKGAGQCRRTLWPSELGGACDGLWTFVPLVVGAMTVAGLSAAGVLFGSGSFLVAAGLVHGIPIVVQSMNAVSAVLLTGSLGPGKLVVTSLVTGAVLLALGANRPPWSVR